MENDLSGSLVCLGTFWFRQTKTRYSKVVKKADGNCHFCWQYWMNLKINYIENRTCIYTYRICVYMCIPVNHVHIPCSCLGLGVKPCNRFTNLWSKWWLSCWSQTQVNRIDTSWWLQPIKKNTLVKFDHFPKGPGESCPKSFETTT